MLSRPAPFHEVQEQFNRQYYSSRGRGVGSMDRIGFGTPSQDPAFVEAHAKEFIDYAKKKEGQLSVHEFGAADGGFAVKFLDYVKLHSPEVYSRTNYVAWEPFEGLAHVAVGQLAKHSKAMVLRSSVEKFEPKGIEKTADFVYCHELFDDTPTKVVANVGGKPQEIWFRPVQHFGYTLLETFHQPLSNDEHSKAIRGFMAGIPDHVRATFQLTASNFMKQARKLLKKGGVLKIEDYGFINKEVLEKYATMQAAGSQPTILSNGYTLATEGMQSLPDVNVATSGPRTHVTALVNFPFMRQHARKNGLKVRVEPTLSWIQERLGKNKVYENVLASGVAYTIPNMVTDYQGLASRFVKMHDLYRPSSKLYNGVKKIYLANMKSANPSIEQTLRDSVAWLETQGVHIPLSKPMKQDGKPGYVVRALRQALQDEIARTGGVLSRIRGKAKIARVDQTIHERDVVHEDRFKPELDELKRMGWRDRDLSWTLFQNPHQHRYSTALVRLTMTAVKK